MSVAGYAAPETVEDAVSALAGAWPDARILAGGTDLIVQMRGGNVPAGLVIDIKKIAETRSISEAPDAYVVGAAVTGAEINAHPGLKADWPGLCEAIDLIGSQQIQGRASPGGNLCNASPAADSVPALIAAGASCTIAGPRGTRDIPVEDVVTGPGKTCLAPGEFVVSFTLPKPPARTGDAYLRLTPRSEMDIAVVGAGVSLTLAEDGTCTHARVALGAVAPRPLLVSEAAAAIIGTSLDAEALDSMAAAASAACQPVDDKRGTVDYRRRVAGVLAKRAALKAKERAEARIGS
mgnify:CR=1 FL=1